LTSDRWWAYKILDPKQRQACWRHLVRDYRRHSKGLRQQSAFGLAGLALTADACGRGAPVPAAKTAAASPARSRVEDELRTLLEAGGGNRRLNASTASSRTNPLKVLAVLWRFVTNPSVGPTNNAAERALRCPIIARQRGRAPVLI